MRHKVGLIRVVTLKDEKLLSFHGEVIQKFFPELEITSRCIEDQPNGIYDRETEEQAVPKILRLVKEFESKGYEAVIVSCAADPAVSEARKMVSIPVVGAGSAVAALALTTADRVGVLNLVEETPRVVRDVLGRRLVAEESPKNVRNTLDLMTDWGSRAAVEALERLLSMKVDAVVLACTGYTTIGFKQSVQNQVSIPVFDAVVASGAAALSLLRQRNKVSHDVQKGR
ncbi:MAG: AroM family protein [Candidatus Caldarchaeum sp.]|nr:AroM family protein [Candidatus Caldarchaeum sp.]